MATRGILSSGVQVCSLKVDTPQLIPGGGTYHVVRFPFGAGESTDRFEMHQVLQPDGYVVADWAADDRSGLIWPSRSGWGHLYGMIQWESASSGSGGCNQVPGPDPRAPARVTPPPQ
ncbi:hypothetical protein ACM6RM_10215, partial [Streptomyces pratensis]